MQFSTNEPLDHKQALTLFLEEAKDHLNNLKGIGHRVVHGGEVFHESVLLDDDTLASLHDISPLAPLHNPMNLMGIEICRDIMPGVPNVAVFDTAFHQSLPESAYLYGVPYRWYEEHQVRRYGFHGTSYRYVSQEAARRLKQPVEQLNLIIAHLGNGCSACVIRQGRSVDTSMGLTPLEGLIMGTRSGDVDPGLLAHMTNETGASLDELMSDLNRKSGLLGLSDLSNDMRTLLAAEQDDNAGAKRAIDAFCFRVARQLSALSCNLSSTDAVVFTGGIGEHSGEIRRRILAAWRNIPYRLDSSLNDNNGNQSGRISEKGTPLVMVIPTDEELMIATDTYQMTEHD
ncbi:MAG: acetate kinase [Thalassolituus sp.]|jgi:acetate kinase|tara:strand:- start:22549 stop:23580 length:1032 start_codon:yes stop_codon:yes gene_type:complete